MKKFLFICFVLIFASCGDVQDDSLRSGFNLKVSEKQPVYSKLLDGKREYSVFSLSFRATKGRGFLNGVSIKFSGDYEEGAIDYVFLCSLDEHYVSEAVRYAPNEVLNLEFKTPVLLELGKVMFYDVQICIKTGDAEKYLKNKFFVEILGDFDTNADNVSGDFPLLGNVMTINYENHGEK